MEEIILVKDAKSSDRDFIINGLVQLQNHEAALHSSRRTGARDLCESYLEAISHKSGSLLVGRVDNVPAGFICFWITDGNSLVESDDSNRCGYISDLYVVDEHRGKGFARRMLEEAEDRLMRHDPSIKRLRICSLAANSLAISAYEAAGFQPYEIVYEKILR